MNLLPRIIQVGFVSGAVALVACSSSSKSSGESAQTTAAKAESEHSEARAQALERLDQATQVVSDVGQKIPSPVANRTQCAVVIPSMVKGGVVIGAQHGSGFAVCQTSQGWSAPAPIELSGGTVGAQLGVQSTDLLALVTSSAAKQSLQGGNFKIGVDASATAGPVGTGRGTGSDVGSNADVVTYSRSKGLFAGAELNGTTIKPDVDATRALFGSPQPLAAILEGRVPVPDAAPAKRFLSAITAGFGRHGEAQSSLQP